MAEHHHEDEDVGISVASVEALRARVHKMSDMMQAHEGTLKEHGALIGALKDNVIGIAEKSATREQLDALHRENGLKHQLLEAKVDSVKADLLPIKQGINKVVWMVLTAVILALMTLVLAGPPHIGK